MNELAISVQRLGKQFALTDSRPSSLREVISRGVMSRARPRQVHRDEARVNWALKDVSFDIQKGEIVGLIGSNGAGKSVLLKILCGITKPSEGRAEIRGRIGALLELGTGFHPELSGRDNIYLNASVLGLNRIEIDEKLEEIIEFSGVGYAINEPVKHYSSGMSMRLAFSIAINLEPEVILLDEVWAVGDADFQKKALAKMQQIISGNAGQRTVVLVSHSMTTIADACTQCLLLKEGRLQMQDRPEVVIREYLSPGIGISLAELTPTFEPKDESHKTEELAPNEGQVTQQDVHPSALAVPEMLSGTWIWRNSISSPGNEAIRLRLVRLLNPLGRATDKFVIGEAITIELIVDIAQSENKYIFGFGVKDLHGSFILANSSEAPDTWLDSTASSPHKGRVFVSCTIPGGVICSMTYSLVLIVGTPDNFGSKPDVFVENSISFDVLPRFYDNHYPLNLSGAIPLNIHWKFDGATADNVPSMLATDVLPTPID